VSSAEGRTGRRLAMLAAGLLAAPAVVAEAPAAGLALAEQVVLCGACHGEDGNSTLPDTPSLAGQPELFVVTQMIYFRERVRRSEVMTPQARGLADPEIEALAAHYARLPAKLLADDPGDPTLQERGREIAATAGCASCHRRNYAGQQQIPRLAAQRADYLAMAMRAYRDQTRGGADTTMTDIMRGASDEDIEALAEYFAQLPGGD
jgi:cytochrome c553